MDDQYCKDACLIIVGPGSDDDLLLAKRRLKCGGRLIHILTEGEGDKRVKIKDICFRRKCGIFPMATSAILRAVAFCQQVGLSRGNLLDQNGPPYHKIGG